ncbi:hypothetical protein LINPERPRIM_LOCUS28498 [Linum perenne]
MALSRLPMICGGGGRRSKVLSRVRSPTAKPTSSPESNQQKVEFLSNNGSESGHDSCPLSDRSSIKNKVMVVVDFTAEAKGALEWALSHVVRSHDSLLLLYVYKPDSINNHCRKLQGDLIRAYELLDSSSRRRPGAKVEVIIREGKNRGPVIVEEAKRQRVSLLVLGQRKRRIMRRVMRRLRIRWRRSSGGGGGEGEAAVKYCIEKAECMTIGVRRQGRRLGGYLITTKRHKNFWLLA